MTPLNDTRFILLLTALAFALFMAAYSYSHAQQIPWVDLLRSQSNVLCCTNNDGRRLDDPDWDTLGTVNENWSGYRVWEDGEWKEVPNFAVVMQRNQDGIVRVWWDREYQGADVIKKVRCFLPGTLG